MGTTLINKDAGAISLWLFIGPKLLVLEGTPKAFKAWPRYAKAKPKWGLRLFTPIPRGSKEWKAEIKNEGAQNGSTRDFSMTINWNRLKVWGKTHWSWRVMIHSINIHLDALLKVCGFNFLEILDQHLSLAA